MAILVSCEIGKINCPQYAVVILVLQLIFDFLQKVLSVRWNNFKNHCNETFVEAILLVCNLTGVILLLVIYYTVVLYNFFITVQK